MGIFDFFKPKQDSMVPETKSSDINPYGSPNAIYHSYFDGEKTPGELGSVFDSEPDHIRLRLRSYDAYLKTNVLRIAFGKVLKQIVGTGLKLQAEPSLEVLKIYGVKDDLGSFTKDIESLFNLYANSILSDYQKMENLHDKANDAIKDSFLGGDCLILFRADKVGINVQVVSGALVSTPLNDTGKGKDNTIVDGVEIDKKGSHVAYWVLKTPLNEFDFDVKHERVKAKDSRGRVVAKLIHGEKNRINDVRGIPKTTPVLEKASKLDRYEESVVSKAEKSANIIYAIEHDKDSIGEDPRLPGAARITPNSSTNKKTDYELSEKTGNRIQQDTSGLTYNMTPGSTLKAFQGAVDSNEYSELTMKILTYICASLDVPVEVALQAYNSNYSASRAAINAWEQILEALRVKFSRDFYKPFYRMYLDYMVLSDTIQLPGYLKALQSNNLMVLEAYSNCRFVGKKVPHIDPLKEVKAVELMLQLKLISHEQAAEILNIGSWEENYKKFQSEGLIPNEEQNNKNNKNNGNTDSDSKA